MNNIFHNPDLQRIDVLDSRFYTLDNETFYPSVTEILSIWPKGEHFETWLKSNGFSSDEIKRRAAEKGSKIHDAIDRYLKGEEITWTKKYYQTKEVVRNGERMFVGDIEEIDTRETQYSFDEWMQILKFVEFYETIQPEVIANEFSLISSKYQLGGTCDILCKINNELWIIDIKSSNYIHKSYFFQVSAYATMFNEINKDNDFNEIDRCGVLWLNSKTRSFDKTGKKIQGKGWILQEEERHYKDTFKIFEHLHKIWLEENPVWKPKTHVYPDRICIRNKP